MDFYKHGEGDLVDTVCLVIFPLVSLMKDQVSILHEKGVKAVVLGPEALFGGHCSTILALKNKIQAVFIDEVHCVAKWLVFFF